MKVLLITLLSHECGETEETNLKNLMIVVVLDLEWNPDLPNTEPQCIMMFQKAHITENHMCTLNCSHTSIQCYIIHSANVKCH